MTGPPYDGKPCPCCPGEIRELYEAAVDVCNQMKRHNPVAAREAVAGLDLAVARMTPLIVAHFKDAGHAFSAE